MERYDARGVYVSAEIRCFTVSDVLVYAGYYSTHPPDEAWEGYVAVAQSLMPTLHGLERRTAGKSVAHCRPSAQRATALGFGNGM